VVTLPSSKKARTHPKQRFKVQIDEKLCKGCYFCIRFCPIGVFVRSEIIGELGYNIAQVEFPEKCTGCKACLLYCPDFAIAVEREVEKD
jgi:2-oxoglutarate ferredoxin oxidoreductase subunit delta